MYISFVKHPIKLLKKPKLFREFYIEKPIDILRYKIFKKKKQYIKLNGKKVVSMEEANNLIFEGLSGNAPFSVIRNGAVECRIALSREMRNLGAVTEFEKIAVTRGCSNAGIFPADNNVAEKFADIYIDSMTSADLSVYWGHILCEKYFFKTYMKKATMIPSRSLEPFGFEKPWTMALKGKKVLVIHPFAKTIERQFENREKLFKNPEMLPEFELKTLKAVQSSANQTCEFENWVEALQFMKDEIDKIDFDIAILGCGGYANPLAAYIKKIGKKAIVLGGLTQLLFGIKGARWEASRPDIVDMYNEYWVRPSDNETPKDYKKVEDGAYW